MTNPLTLPIKPGSRVLTGDVALAVVGAVAEILLVAFPPHVHGTRHNGPLGGVTAVRCAFAATMAIPIAWRRVRPMAVGAALLIAAVANATLIGHVVRCGPALPMLLVTAYTAGRWRARGEAVGTWALCFGAAAVQSLSDPDLDTSVMPLFAVLLAVVAGAGWLITGAEATSAELRRSNRALRRQREQTAELAVANDRERISVGLDTALRDRLHRMAALSDAPDEPSVALAGIEQIGREALDEMREVVGSLRTAAETTGPQPVLAQLHGLLLEASSDSRLTIDELPDDLPPGVELSAYRIVEHAVAALEAVPDERLDVRIAMHGSSLEIDISAPAVDDDALGRAVVGIRQRAAFHGGTLEVSTSPGLSAVVRLPITA